MSRLDLVASFLVFARAGGILAVWPATASATVPIRIRLALGLMLSFFTAPLLPAGSVSIGDLTFWAIFRSLLSEVSAGLLLGFITRIVYYAVEFTGGIIATEMGLMLAANFNPLNSAPVAAPGTALFWLATMMMFTCDLHHWILAAFQRSFVFLPLGGAILTPALLSDFVGRTAGIFSVAVQMAAPIMAVSFVIMLVFSILGRVVPQMNVFTESFSVKILAGLGVFGLSMNFMGQQILEFFRHLPEDFLRVCQLLGGG